MKKLPHWATHFQALADKLGRRPNARPFGQGIRFTPSDPDEYRLIQSYLNELEKNEGISWFSYSFHAEISYKVAIRGLPADTDPELIMNDLREKGYEPEYARSFKARGGRPGCIFFCILKRTPGLIPANYDIDELLLMPGV